MAVVAEQGALPNFSLDLRRPPIGERSDIQLKVFLFWISVVKRECGQILFVTAC